MVGRGLDEFNSQLLKWLDCAEFRSYFHLVGEQSDIHLWYNAMDIYCLSSKSEGFPNALVEAMAMGLPCVSTEVGDAKSILNGHGILAHSNNVQALIDALLFMLRMTPDERFNLGQSARQSVLNTYSIKSIYNHYHHTYSSNQI